MMKEKIQEDESFKAVRKQTLEYSGAFREKGITLIALVITIVVLLILAGISLNLVLGENGIVTKAKDAREQTIIGHEKEQINLAYSACKTRENFEDLVTASELETEMKKSNENVSVAADGDNLVITFEETKHQYNIGQDGNYIENVDWSKLEPGLYKTGTSEMIKSWQELIDDGEVTVQNGALDRNRTHISEKGDLIISDQVNQIYAKGETCGTIRDDNIIAMYIPGSVKVIGNSGLRGFCALEKLVIAEGCKSIGYYALSYGFTSAFGGKSQLKDIEFPNSIENIEDIIFDYGDSPWLDDQPDGEVYIGKVLYSYKGVMPQNTNLQIKDGTKMIAPRALKGETMLYGVTLPDSVEKIGESAFSNCTNLSDINGIENVISIGGDAFCKTKWYENQPDGEIYIGKNLYGYKGIMPENTSLRIREGTLNISDRAFSDFTGVVEVIIPSSVKYIGNAFGGCKNLATISGAENVERIGSMAFGGTKWKNNHEDGCIYIGKTFYCYKGDNIPEKIQIKEGTKSISSYAIEYLKPTATINIPKSIEFIDRYVFTRVYGSDIEYVINYEGTEEEWNSIQIDGSNYIGNLTINYNYTGE